MKTAIITGGTSGIGKETAIGLARLDWNVVITARDKNKAESTIEEIKNKTGKTISWIEMDLGSLSSVRNAASLIMTKYSRIDVLINNAGGIFNPRQVTKDGFEQTIGVNHLGPFLFTNLLMDLLKSSSPSRIINVSSTAHMMGRINFSDIMYEKKYSSMGTYSQSKLANVLFTYELARRLHSFGVVSNTLHPGVVGTSFSSDNTGIIAWFFKQFKKLLLTPEQGALTSIYLASSDEVVNISGKYFAKCKIKKSSPASYNTDTAKRLWELSEKLVGL